MLTFVNRWHYFDYYSLLINWVDFFQRMKFKEIGWNWMELSEAKWNGGDGSVGLRFALPPSLSISSRNSAISNFRKQFQSKKKISSSRWQLLLSFSLSLSLSLSHSFLFCWYLYFYRYLFIWQVTAVVVVVVAIAFHSDPFNEFVQSAS